MSALRWLFGNYSDTKTEDNHKPLESVSKKIYYLSRYNWIVSYPQKKYAFMDETILNQFITVTHDDAGKEIVMGKKYIDLRSDCPTILEDKQLNMSPISTICFILHYQLIRNKLDIFPPSRAFIYHNIAFFEDSRKIFTFESIFNSIQNYGFCSELSYAYTNEHIQTNTIKDKCYREAEQYTFINIYRVPNSINMIKNMLRNKMIIAIGFILYNNIHINSDINISDTNTNSIVGGASGAIVGYIETKQSFIVALSYGPDMGKNGYILLPYKYVENSDLVPELYYIDFDVTQVQNYMVNQKRILHTMPQEQRRPYGGLFS